MSDHYERVELGVDGIESGLGGPERDEMVCDRCHRRHGVVWHADSDLWNAVMREGDRGKPDEFSFCCPTCFMQLATERGHGSFFAVAGASYDEEDTDD